MSKLYPIKVLLDANKKPFIPFITSTSIVVDGTEYTIQDMFDMRYTKEEVDAIIQSLGTLQRLRGRVDTYEDLLLIEGQQAGDTYIVGTSDTENAEYMWIGEKWEKLGPLVDLTDYYNKADIDALLASADANIAGAIAQGDNETLNLAKNYAEDKVAEAMSNISIAGALNYKGHVSSVEALPSTGQPSGNPTSNNFSIPSSTTGDAYDPTDGIEDSYLNGLKSYINATYNYYVGGLTRTSNSSTCDYTAVVSDFPNVIDGIALERGAINGYYYGYLLVHITYDPNKPVYIKSNTRNSFTPDSTGEYGTNGNIATNTFVQVTESGWVPISHGCYKQGVNHPLQYLCSNLPNIKYKPFTGSSVFCRGSAMTAFNYTSITNQKTYTYTEDMQIFKFINEKAQWVDAESQASENDLYTVGDAYELYRCNAEPAWEHWSQGDGYSKEEIDAMFGEAEAALDEIIEGV